MLNSNLRPWQQRALKAYQEADSQDFLAMVTPGGGKTIWALVVAQSLLGSVQRIVVVSPTIVIKSQWKEVAKPFGIRLADFGDRDSSATGVVTTYQQVALAKEEFAAYCSETPTLVILDEIHHAGQEKSWGQGLTEAFSGSRRLSMTGTPFRTDDCQIAFVRYGGGVCSPDFIYSYPEAVMDGHCRRLLFPAFHGEGSWRIAGNERSASLSEALHGRENTARLNSIMDPDSGFVRSMLSMADLFHSQVPDLFIRQVFHTMTQCPQHIFMVLTKRAQRLGRLAPVLPWPPNVWCGVSVESRDWTDRLATLRKVPALVRFVSCEPLLESLLPINLQGIHQVIAGGESGWKARPMNPDWARELRDECALQKCAFFMKQMGGRQDKRSKLEDLPEDLKIREWPANIPPVSVGGPDGLLF